MGWILPCHLKLSQGGVGGRLSLRVFCSLSNAVLGEEEREGVPVQEWAEGCTFVVVVGGSWGYMTCPKSQL